MGGLEVHFGEHSDGLDVGRGGEKFQSGTGGTLEPSRMVHSAITLVLRTQICPNVMPYLQYYLCISSPLNRYKTLLSQRGNHEGS